MRQKNLKLEFATHVLSIINTGHRKVLLARASGISVAVALTATDPFSYLMK
jgi:hypothetical protein